MCDKRKKRSKREKMIEKCHRVAAERGGFFIAEEYKGVNERHKFRCAEGHEWEPILKDVLHRNTWCQICSIKARSDKRRSSIENCQYLASLKNGKCLSIEYIDNNSHLLWECEFGHQWPATRGHIQQGEWCPYCVGKAKRDIQYCTSYAEIMGGKFLSTEYFTNKDDYWWQCGECDHKWKASSNNVIDQGTWCPECSGEKRKKTWIKNHGVDHPSKSKKVVEKTKETFMRNYGVDHPMKTPEFALSIAKKLNNLYTLQHWFSQEEIICVGTWEKKSVEFFNKNNIDYLWQIQTFTMPDGRTYRPDCYLPDEDLWIEIKGRFMGDAEEKWNWFQSEYPNSELWNEEKLKQLGIL